MLISIYVCLLFAATVIQVRQLYHDGLQNANKIQLPVIISISYIQSIFLPQLALKENNIIITILNLFWDPLVISTPYKSLMWCLTSRIPLTRAACQFAVDIWGKEKLLFWCMSLYHMVHKACFIVKVGLRIHLAHRDKLLCDSGGSSTVPLMGPACADRWVELSCSRPGAPSTSYF